MEQSSLSPEQRADLRTAMRDARRRQMLHCDAEAAALAGDVQDILIVLRRMYDRIGRTDRLATLLDEAAAEIRTHVESRA